MPAATKIPLNWPSTLIYLTSPRRTNTVQSEALRCEKQALRPDTATAPPTYPPGPSPVVRITPITSPSHPAHRQHGLFAVKALPPDAFVIFYLGLVHGPGSDTDESSDYDLSLDREAGIGVDAAHMGNEARFINDYRGVREEGPNAEFRDCWVEVGKGVVERRIGVFVLPAGKKGRRSKGIAKGEEVLVSYGKGFWQHRTAAVG